MSAADATAVSELEAFEPPPESSGRPAWRRLRRNIVAVKVAIDLTIAWMDPQAAQAGTRRTTVGRIA